jgi:hypothetical protein
MKKVKLEIFDCWDPPGDYNGVIVISTNGKTIAKGYYGGCPEDNSRLRDYRWVQDALHAVSESLGAEVEVRQYEVSPKEFGRVLDE